MTYYDDPKKQIEYLQQCLSNDKKPIGIFLGAGCPSSIRNKDAENIPLIPDINGISKAVQASLSKSDVLAPLIKIIQSNFDKDKKTQYNIEDILDHIRSLRAIVGCDKVRGLSITELDKLDEFVCNTICDLTNKVLPDNKTPYHQVAIWLEGIKRNKAIEIFTTNYDILMEQALEECRVPYFDGFIGARNSFFDIQDIEEEAIPARWTRLWKLHGSINWFQIDGKGVFRCEYIKGGTKRVIHPSHLKYEESRRMPYLAMFDRLRAFFRQPTAVFIIIGYSFHDEHINEVIVQGLQRNPTAIAFALLFEEIEKYSQAVELAKGRPNLTILAKDGAVISNNQLNWPEKDPETEIHETNEWIKWKLLDPKNQSSKLKAELLLGDFLIFGRFLQEIVGRIQQQQEDSHAK